MSQLDLTSYQTLIFDCDGVILNSNKIKTEAFYHVALAYGETAAQALVDYHVQNGGISRYKKFEYLLTKILGKEILETELNALLEAFAREVKKGLMTCDVAEDLKTFRARTQHASWLIVSGGDQVELREVFAARGLDQLFDGGIFGSPYTKDTILARELSNQNITKPSLFLGDSKYDYQAATNAELDFVFISEWSEVEDWEEWVKNYKLKSCRNIKLLI